MAGALVALAMIGAGCGGGGDDSSTSAGSAAEAGARQAQADATLRDHNEEVREEYEKRRQLDAPSAEETEAKQSASDFYEILDGDKAARNPDRGTIDSASFCELMSEDAVAQTIHYARISSGIAQQWDCESAVDFLVIRSKRVGAFEGAQGAEVVGVNARGDRATATVRFADGPATALAMVKEDGEWKLAATPAEVAR